MDDRRAADRPVPVERRRGRPRLSEHPNTRIELRLPNPAYDALCRVAIQRGIPVATLARRILIARIFTVSNSDSVEPSPTL
jgi:hypothetical protein